jgi:hypothetical protein
VIRWDDRNGRWRWEFDRRIEDGRGSATRTRKSKLLPRGLSKTQAEAVAMKMEAEVFTRARLIATADDWDDYVAGMLATPGSWLHSQAAQTRHRTRARGSEGAGLTPREIADLLLRSRGRCEVTGIAFQRGRPARARSSPFLHSIDRIDSSRGYEAWNCRVVCYAVNVAMNSWGEEVFAKIATGWVVNRYCAINILTHSGWEKTHQPGPHTE